MEIVCEDGDDFVAVYFVATFVNHKTAVAVAVVSDAEIQMVFLDKGF